MLALTFREESFKTEKEPISIKKAIKQWNVVV